MSAKATPPKCHPKNSQLQSALTASCTRNRVRAVRAARNPPTRQTNHAAIPMTAYSTLQTGPNTSGGSPLWAYELRIERASLYGRGAANGGGNEADRKPGNTTKNLLVFRQRHGSLQVLFNAS